MWRNSRTVLWSMHPARRGPRTGEVHASWGRENRLPATVYSLTLTEHTYECRSSCRYNTSCKSTLLSWRLVNHSDRISDECCDVRVDIQNTSTPSCTRVSRVGTALASRVGLLYFSVLMIQVAVVDGCVAPSAALVALPSHTRILSSPEIQTLYYSWRNYFKNLYRSDIFRCTLYSQRTESFLTKMSAESKVNVCRYR